MAVELTGEIRYIGDLVSRIVKECPRRQATSDDERKSHEIIRIEMQNAGLELSRHDFRFSDNLYANFALHFSLGVVGTLLFPFVPLLSVVLHLVPAVSYWAESTRRGYFLRRLFPFKPSQNVIGKLAAQGVPKLRVVFLSHVDAAFTGVAFHPWILERLARLEESGKGRFKTRPAELAVNCLVALACIDFLWFCIGPWSPLWSWVLGIEVLLTLPAVIITFVNLEAVIRNEIVPGANDNLSAVAALPVLAKRLMLDKHPDVEYLFIATGCEEASLGGADALARDMKGIWDKNDTVVVALDGLSMGDLFYVEGEGEVVRIEAPLWLTSLTQKVAASEARFNEVKGFEIPVGGTDASAFLAHGYDAMGLICVDPKYGAPRGYHRPEDNPENLEVDKIVYCIDFIEKLTKAVVAQRL
ncbi:M28 family peptidase [Bdellovibrionota bacterium FG-2]